MQGKEDCHETHCFDRRVVLGAGLSAQADTVTYHNVFNAAQRRPAASGRLLLRRAGRTGQNGVPTSAAYKQCMLSRGWRYQFVNASRRRNLDQSGHRTDLPRHPQRLRLRMFEFLKARPGGSACSVANGCVRGLAVLQPIRQRHRRGLPFFLPFFLPAFFTAIAGAACSAASRARRSSFRRALLAATAAATASIPS